MAYSVHLAQVKNVVHHPNADRLDLVSVLGGSVSITSRDQYKVGDHVLYFPVDGQLSNQYAKANDLIPRFDEEGNKINNTFFRSHLRIQAINLRSMKSFGYIAPLSSLQYVFDQPVTPHLVEVAAGQSKTFRTLTWGGKTYPIAHKYITRKTRSLGQKVTKRREVVMFPRHFDTNQLRHIDPQTLPVDTEYVITEKLHGTSQRYGHVWYEREIEPSLARRVLAMVFGRYVPSLRDRKYVGEWEHILGTRRVVRGTRDEERGNSFYNNEAFRWNVVDGLHLRKGEVIYGEVVGYTTNGGSLMPPQDTSKLRDKTIKQQFGKTMVYHYGLEEGQADFYVYRIAMVNEDGDMVDYSWRQVEERCQELGLKTVPVILKGYLREGEQPNIVAFLDDVCEGPTVLGGGHMREGVTLRLETGSRPLVLKHKSHTFLVLEGHTKDREDLLDLEESS